MATSAQPGLLETLRREMRLRNYSHKTIKAYASCVRLFAMYFRPRHPRDAKGEDIRKYLLHLMDEKQYSAATINHALNALRFLYVELYKLPFVLGEIRRPKKDHNLPVVLSTEEVKRIFDGLENLKHKTVLMMIYSGGLRLGEVLRLRPEDIDSDRMMIHLREAKGRKDRYVMLSDAILETLRAYWKQYKPRKYLFEGQEEEKPYSPRSVQKIFEQATERAAIRKPVTVHSLRHAFATHLLEQGTDLRYIQELLGHASSKTTEIYTHVSKRDIGRIKSPIDQMFPRSPPENQK
jgi:site-specific recombinase XerD